MRPTRWRGFYRDKLKGQAEGKQFMETGGDGSHMLMLADDKTKQVMQVMVGKGDPKGSDIQIMAQSPRGEVDLRPRRSDSGRVPLRPHCRRAPLATTCAVRPAAGIRRARAAPPGERGIVSGLHAACGRGLVTRPEVVARPGISRCAQGTAG
jgi:hypothetical protein